MCQLHCRSEPGLLQAEAHVPNQQACEPEMSSSLLAQRTLQQDSMRQRALGHEVCDAVEDDDVREGAEQVQAGHETYQVVKGI